MSEAWNRELLIRYADSSLSSDELIQAENLLRESAEARSFLRDLAEQAVMIADLQRTSIDRHEALCQGRVETASGLEGAGVRSRSTSSPMQAWRAALAILFVGLLAVTAFAYVATAKPTFATVSDVAGATHYFSGSGRAEHALVAGMRLAEGDTLESRSCDASITLEVHRGKSITIAGHSAIRALHAQNAARRLELLHGVLWITPSASGDQGEIVIQTSTATIASRDAMLSVRTSEAETVVNVNAGEAFVTQALDGKSAHVRANQRILVTLREGSPFEAITQPLPVHAWSLRALKGPEVSLGALLTPTGKAPIRLGASPLLWPLPNRDPILLYVVAIAIWKGSEQPVVLKPGSRIRFRGIVNRQQAIRVGMSTQRMQGVFSGKFEVDIPIERLGKPGEIWEVEVPIANFHPLSPELARSPENLELTDVYALTIQSDAGLEIHDMELKP